MLVSSMLGVPRPSLSVAERALRLQRIFARMQEGASYKDIAAEEGLSRERLRQIIKRATRRPDLGEPDHKLMQFARLMPALRLARQAVAEGDAKAIPTLLKLVDRLDRYADPERYFVSPTLEGVADPRSRRKRRSPAAIRPTAARSPAPVERTEAEEAPAVSSQGSDAATAQSALSETPSP